MVCKPLPHYPRQLPPGNQFRQPLKISRHHAVFLNRRRHRTNCGVGSLSALGRLERCKEIDRLRWNLVQNVMSRLTAELERIGKDEKSYPPLLRILLAQAAAVIDEKELVAELNARDHARLSRDWEAFCRDAGVKQRIVLAPDPVVSLGGVRVRNANDTIRVDNSFEGRLERLQEALHQVVMERLFASTAPIGAIIGG